MARKMTLYKLVVLGDEYMGKTALTIQLCLNHFVETYEPTIEDSYRKQVVIDQRACIVEVLDTGGQGYPDLRDQWIRDGEGFVLVYSITSRNSFSRIQNFFNEIKNAKDSTSASSSFGPVPVMLVGNKADRTHEREVSSQEGQALAKGLGCMFVEASAKNSTNVEKAFYDVVRRLQKRAHPETQQSRKARQPKVKSRRSCAWPSAWPVFPSIWRNTRANRPLGPLSVIDVENQRPTPPDGARNQLEKKRVPAVASGQRTANPGAIVASVHHQQQLYHRSVNKSHSCTHLISHNDGHNLKIKQGLRFSLHIIVPTPKPQPKVATSTPEMVPFRAKRINLPDTTNGLPRSPAATPVRFATKLSTQLPPIDETSRSLLGQTIFSISRPAPKDLTTQWKAGEERSGWPLP